MMMMTTLLQKEFQTIREYALDLFWQDDANLDEFLKGADISDEVLKEGGYWDEAQAQVYEKMRG